MYFLVWLLAFMFDLLISDNTFISTLTLTEPKRVSIGTASQKTNDCESSKRLIGQIDTLLHTNLPV